MSVLEQICYFVMTNDSLKTFFLALFFPHMVESQSNSENYDSVVITRTVPTLVPSGGKMIKHYSATYILIFV